MENLWLLEKEKQSQKKEEEMICENESHKFFLSRILMVTRFIYVCLEKFNSFLINSSLSSENFLSCKVARWEMAQEFFALAFADAQLDFDLSEIYSNINVSISYEYDFLRKNKSWLLVDDIVIVFSFTKLKNHFE